MKLFLFLPFLLLFCSCETVVAHKEFLPSSVCDEMMKVGNINDLFIRLANETNKVKEILRSSDLERESDREKLHRHALTIEEIGKKINELSIPAYTYEQFEYDAYWLVSPRTFSSKLGRYIPSGFKIYDAEIVDVYYMGEKRDDLKDRFTLKVNEDDDKNSAFVEFKSPSSYLFSCQLKQTMLVTLKIYARNLIFKKDYYVSLLLQ